MLELTAAALPAHVPDELLDSLTDRYRRRH
jgi:hypothetical protein